MKTLLITLAAWLLLQLPLAAHMTIAESGKSSYQIVVAHDAIPSERYAAEELQRYLERMSGVKLPITTDSEPAQAREILVGDSARVRQIEPQLDLKPVGPDGFILRTVGERVL